MLASLSPTYFSGAWRALFCFPIVITENNPNGGAFFKLHLACLLACLLATPEAWTGTPKHWHRPRPQNVRSYWLKLKILSFFFFCVSFLLRFLILLVLLNFVRRIVSFGSSLVSQTCWCAVYKSRARQVGPANQPWLGLAWLGANRWPLRALIVVLRGDHFSWRHSGV